MDFFWNNPILLLRYVILISCWSYSYSCSLFFFLFLFSGILSLLSVLYSKLGQVKKSATCLSRLLSLSDNVCGQDALLPDEVLYGRAGYLFSLLYARKHFGAEKIDKDILDKVMPTKKQ